MFSLPMNLASRCLEQMNVPVSIDVIRDRYAANCVLEHDRFGGGSVMVWAGIRHDGRSLLLWRELTERSVPRSTGMRYCSIMLFH